MPLAQPFDLTVQFNAAGAATIDIGQFNAVTVQLVTPAGAVSFLTSNDSGAIQGTTDGNATSAANFTAVTGIDLATGTGVTSLAATGNVRFENIGRYLRMTGTTAAKVLVLGRAIQ